MQNQNIKDLFDQFAATEGLLPYERDLIFDLVQSWGRGEELDFEEKYTQFPVPIDVFVKSPDYMHMADEVYPKVMEELIEMNSGKYVEAVLTGGIGSGKTTTALYTTAYQLYLMSILRDPHKTFGLDKSSEIILIFQNKTERLAKQVGYKRFKTMIDLSPYFQNNFLYNHKVESLLMFPNRIEVMPLSGDATAAIGGNVMGGVIDELNYMDVIVDSKKSLMDGGIYDQATETYNAIARRRKSRFQRLGKLPGILCLVSSRRYPGQFTDIKEEEAKTNDTIYVYDYCVWEIQPEGSFTEGMFRVFAGDANQKPRVLGDNELVNPKDEHLVKEVPKEYRAEFDRDLYEALREIAGISTLAAHPYFTNRELVAASFGRTKSVLTQETCDFVHEKVSLMPMRIQNPEKPRWVHIDLSLVTDKTGISCGYVDGFQRVDRGKDMQGNPVKEILPVIKFDFTLRVKAPPSGEIQFEKIRRLLYVCRTAGMNIRWVSLDGFQSADTMQLLRNEGFVSGHVSVDKDDRAYSFTKSAMYDGRVWLPEDDFTQNEFNRLERDQKKGKIDHPPNGSKDVADSVAGVIGGLTMRREIWISHDIPLGMIPDSVKTIAVLGKNVRESTEDEKAMFRED